MTRPEKLYTLFCVFFSTLTVIGNVTFQKFVTLPLGSFHTFTLSVGAIIYPFTFLVMDLMTEFFGREKASLCILLSMGMNVLCALLIFGMDSLTATAWSVVDDATFHKVYGLYGLAFFGSIVALYIAQKLDIVLYLWIRRFTHNRFLWLRSSGSTAISLFLDTCVVIGILTFFHILPRAEMGTLIIGSYLFKAFATFLSIPFFYLCVWAVRRFIFIPQHG